MREDFFSGANSANAAARECAATMREYVGVELCANWRGGNFYFFRRAAIKIVVENAPNLNRAAQVLRQMQSVRFLQFQRGAFEC